jgi:hypothetical protein
VIRESSPCDQGDSLMNLRGASRDLAESHAQHSGKGVRLSDPHRWRNKPHSRLLPAVHQPHGNSFLKSGAVAPTPSLVRGPFTGWNPAMTRPPPAPAASPGFRAPWKVAETPRGFRVDDADGQPLAYVWRRAAPQRQRQRDDPGGGAEDRSLDREIARSGGEWREIAVERRVTLDRLSRSRSIQQTGVSCRQRLRDPG